MPGDNILIKNPPQTPDMIGLGHCSDFHDKTGCTPREYGDVKAMGRT